VSTSVEQNKVLDVDIRWKNNLRVNQWEREKVVTFTEGKSENLKKEIGMQKKCLEVKGEAPKIYNEI